VEPADPQYILRRDLARRVIEFLSIWGGAEEALRRRSGLLDFSVLSNHIRPK